MGMNLPLGNFYQEDTILLTTEMIASSDLINLHSEVYGRYLKKEQFRSCRIGIPFVVEDRIFDPSALIPHFTHSLPIQTEWFSYMDMSLRHDINRWTWTFPELFESKTLYIKCSRSINWNEFLSSLWDFAKNNINIVLLDTNKVLYHPKYEKLLQSLTLRGVSLGFNGIFPKHWLLGPKQVVRKMAQLEAVDFWQTSYFDNQVRTHQEELSNKLLYFNK